MPTGVETSTAPLAVRSTSSEIRHSAPADVTRHSDRRSRQHAPPRGTSSRLGVGVLVTDSNSHAEDGGRADLLGSLPLRTRVRRGACRRRSWSVGPWMAWPLGSEMIHVSLQGPGTQAHRLPAGAVTEADRLSRRPTPRRYPRHSTTSRVGSIIVTSRRRRRCRSRPRRVAILAARPRQLVGRSRVAELPADHGTIAGARSDAEVVRCFGGARSG